MAIGPCVCEEGKGPSRWRWGDKDEMNRRGDIRREGEALMN